MPTPVAAEGVRNVGESALLVDVLDGRLRGQSRSDRLLEVEPDELAVGGGDLLAYDHLESGIHLAEAQSTVDRVVIGDADRGELGLPGECGEVGERDAAIAGVLGVHVHVEPDLLHPTRSGRRRARRGYGTRG